MLRVLMAERIERTRMGPQKWTISPAVAGMGRPFRDVDWTVSIGLIEETHVALILVFTDIMDG